MAEKIPPQDTPNDSPEEENQDPKNSSSDKERERNIAKFNDFLETSRQLENSSSIKELFASYDAQLHDYKRDPIISSAFFNGQNFARYIRQQVFLKQVDLRDIIERLRTGVAEAEENVRICVDQRTSYVKTGNESIDLYMTERLGERIPFMKSREENVKEALALLEETHGKYLASGEYDE